MEDGDCDALMLAYAGVKRMGYEDMVVNEFDAAEFTPPVGQGCIAIEAATSLDADKIDHVRQCLNNKQSEICLLTERAFLRKLEGGCSIPAFGYATLSEDGSEVTLTAGLASLDGATILRKTETGSAEDPEAVGASVGEYVLANNGKEMLAKIRREQAESGI